MSRCRFASSVPGLAAGLLALIASPSASDAHVQITAPKQRHAEMKAGPCGLAGGERSADVCELQPGSIITVTWDETVEHPGHFRISFDEDGVDDLVDPSDYDDLYTAPSVLLDDIGDRDVDVGGDPRYSVEVQLPDVECDNCTLQLIQVMTDKEPWGPEGGKDLYYQCADLVLSRSAPATPAEGCGAARPSDGDGGPGGAPDAGPSGDDGGDDDTGDDGSDDGAGASDAGAGGDEVSSSGCAASGRDAVSAGLGLLITVASFFILWRRRAGASSVRRRRSPDR
jgi:hypothetical protein